MGVSATTGRFITWPLGTDPYSNADLTANWNTADAAIGVAFSGAHSLYAEVSALKQEREPLGTIKWWYRFNANYPVPTGFVICDGRAVGTNDLKDSTGVALDPATLTPNLVGKIPVGANSGATDGTAWTNTAAPGIGGTGGSNATITVNAIMPDHYHEFSHIHQVGPIDTGDGFETGSVPTGQGWITTGGSGSIQVARDSHKHNMSIYSSKARVDANENDKLSDISTNTSAQTRPNTSEQYVATGGTATTPTGGTAGDTMAASATFDARPAGFGLLPIMKVRYTTVS